MKKVLLMLTIMLAFSCTKETIIEGTPGADGADGDSVSFTVVDNGNGCETITIYVNGVEKQKSTVCDGADGSDGTDGVDGTNGTDGSNGTDGQDGSDGVDGQDGADGADGEDASGSILLGLSGDYVGTNTGDSITISNVVYSYVGQSDRYTFDVTTELGTVKAYFDLVSDNINDLTVEGEIGFATTYLLFPHYRIQEGLISGLIRDRATDDILSQDTYRKQ